MLSETILPKQTRCDKEGFEIAEMAEAANKKLESEDPFEDIIADATRRKKPLLKA